MRLPCTCGWPGPGAGRHEPMCDTETGIRTPEPLPLPLSERDRTYCAWCESLLPCTHYPKKVA